MTAAVGNGSPGPGHEVARALRGMARASRRAFLGMAALAMLATAPDTLRADDPEGVEPESSFIVVFAGRTGEYGSEVWSTRRTTGSTFLVADIRPGSQGSNPGPFWNTGDGTALFMADDGTHGRELWVTDGGTARLVGDLSPGAQSSQIHGSRLKVIRGGLAIFGLCSFYCDDAETWVSWGGGAWPLKDESGEQVRFTDLLAREVEQRVAPVDSNRVVMAAESPGYRDQLWLLEGRSGADARATPILDRDGDPIQGPRQFTPLGDGTVLFFAFQWKSGPALWITDGTPRGTRIVRKDFPGVSSPLHLHRLTSPRPGIAVFLTGAIGGDDWAVWSTDGTRAGTRRARVVPGSSGGLWDFAVLTDQWILFQLSNGNLWYTNGQREGTGISFRADRLISLAPIGFDAALFAYPHPRRTAGGPLHGFEPWVVKGNPPRPQLLRNIDRRIDDDGKHRGSLDDIPFEVTVLSPGFAVFPASDGQGGRDIWFTNIGAATTRKVRELSNIAGAQIVDGTFGPLGGGSAAFTMWTYDGITWNYPQIWMTDGSRGGTRALCKGVYGSAFTPLGAFGEASEKPAPAAPTPASEPGQVCDD